MAEKKTKKNGEAAKPRGPITTNEDFVRTWQGCTSGAEAREKLGGHANARAKRLRDAGVKLKMFPRANAAVIDAAALNALIEAK